MTAHRDFYAVACNYVEGTHTSATGALAYLADWHWSGGGFERVRVVARSRGGRWITIWTPISRLTNFRSKTIPPDHPMFTRRDIGRHDTRGEADAFAQNMEVARAAWFWGPW